MLEKAIAADPGFAMAHAKLSVVHANQGDMPRAREFAARALERADRLPPAERYYIEGRYYSLDPATLNRAMAAYQAAVDAVPDLTAARNNLAQLLLQSRRHTEALAHLEELRRRGMSFPGTYMSLAEAYVASGQVERAEQALTEYVAKHRDRAAGYENLGMFLVNQGRYEEALRSFDRAGDLDGRNFKVDYGHFAVHVLQGRWLEAEANARSLAASSYPRERWTGGAALAVLALYDGDLTSARGIWQEGLRLADSPDERARVRIALAELAADLGKGSEALAEVKRAMAEGPQESGLVAKAHACRATCLAREGKLEDAQSSREEVDAWLRSLPAPIAQPHRLRLEGEIAWGEGDYARARELLGRAAALLPEATVKNKAPAARIFFALGRAALADGKPEEAREAFARVVNGGMERLWEPVAYVRSLAHLARLEEQAGRAEEARRLYALYLGHWGESEIDLAEVAAARERLAALGGPPAEAA
jgi:tetratricopeptide (TPR) repeat protein